MAVIIKKDGFVIGVERVDKERIKVLENAGFVIVLR